LNTYLITGGCGFIGSHIAEELVNKGRAVIKIYDNLSSGFEQNITGFLDKVEFIQADIRDASSLAFAMKNVDYVFHEAALVSVFDSIERPIDNHAINITGTLNVLNAAREARVKRVVIASSAAVYGNNPELPKTEAMKPEPESPYGLAKISDEYYMSIFAKLYGLKTVILRYFNVYGPRQDPGSMYSGVISKFFNAMLKGRNPTVFGDGLQTRDFVFVKDIARANLLAMQNSSIGKGEIFNIGTGKETSLLDLLAILKDITGNNFEIQFKDARPGDIKHSVADITQAKKKLDYAPRYDIKIGFKELLAAVKSP